MNSEAIEISDIRADICGPGADIRAKTLYCIIAKTVVRIVMIAVIIAMIFTLRFI